MEPNIVQLSIGKVELIEKLTWGLQEQIRATMYGGLRVQGHAGPDGAAGSQNVEFDGTAITRSKYKTIEVCVKKITLNDGTEVAFTRDWLDNLSVEDGDALYEKVNVLATGKKK